MNNILGSLLYTSLLWEWYFVTENVPERCIPVLAFKWCRPVKHLVYQDTQSPPIHSTGMPAAFNYLWRNVFLSTDKRIGPEIGNTGLRVNSWESRRGVAASCGDHCGSTPGP